MQRSAERQAFERYLRTGRKLPPDAFRVATVPLETKFNPYHDPRNGQFTSASAELSSPSRTPGKWEGGGFTGGGGGSFGGGGATGSWGQPSSTRPRSLTLGQRPNSSDRPATGTTAAAVLTTGAPGRTIVRNGYSYRLDTADRTTSVSGTLNLASEKQRSRSAQTSAGGNDWLSTDDGGHYIAARFNGPTDTFNHFAQDANFNRGGYRVLESRWAKNVKEGKQVYVAITPTYVRSSKRPSRIDVVYWVNGARDVFIFEQLERTGAWKMRRGRC